MPKQDIVAPIAVEVADGINMPGRGKPVSGHCVDC